VHPREPAEAGTTTIERAVRSVPFYFDVVSPYSWLALMEAESFAARHAVRWELRPVVYAALLEAHGLVGPVETPAKRRYTMHDVVRAARRRGLRIVGPPAHPFRSLEALRLLESFRDDPRVLRLAVALADACWGDGRELTDPEVLRDVLAAVGLETADLEQRLSAEPVKQALRRATEAAIASGVFGVPTFLLDGELFWGHDRLDHLAARLAGEPSPREDAERLLARPAGVVRPGAGR